MRASSLVSLALSCALAGLLSGAAGAQTRPDVQTYATPGSERLSGWTSIPAYDEPVLEGAGEAGPERARQRLQPSRVRSVRSSHVPADVDPALQRLWLTAPVGVIVDVEADDARRRRPPRPPRLRGGSQDLLKH